MDGIDCKQKQKRVRMSVAWVVCAFVATRESPSSLIHSFTHSLIHSFTHSLIHSGIAFQSLAGLPTREATAMGRDREREREALAAGSAGDSRVLERYPNGGIQ